MTIFFMDFGLIPSSPTLPASNDVAKTLYGVGGEGSLVLTSHVDLMD